MTRKNLFHNASVKLTATYLLIIMLISLLFSAAVYRVSAEELDSSLNRPLSQTERRILITDGRDGSATLIRERAEEANEAKQRLLNQLTVINIFILAVGGLVSYLLARRSLKPIETAHAAQSRFTADASHELRTPITAMRAETELTLTEPKLTLAQAKIQLQSNIEELDKLTELSEGLLQLARMDTEDIQYEHVGVDDIVSQAIKRTAKRTKLKKQKVTASKTKNLDVRVHIVSITEAIVTVIDNASKYSPEESTIYISTKKTRYTVSITIKDSGMGIEPSDLPYIFDRFYRADTSRTRTAKQHGYGIGLSLAKQAVEASGGSISVKSKPDKGSAFTISLPR